MDIREYSKYKDENLRSLNTLLDYYSNIDQNIYNLMQKVVATLNLENKSIDEKSIIDFTVNIIEKFYDSDPIQVNNELVKIANTIVNKNNSDLTNLKKLFDWVVKEISYGSDYRGVVGYRTSLETFWKREGVCGEMAILFLALAKIANINCYYTSVLRDNNDKEVLHACVAYKNNDEVVLIDPSYNTFNIKHKEFYIQKDNSLRANFKSFRRLKLDNKEKNIKINFEHLKSIFPD